MNLDQLTQRDSFPYSAQISSIKNPLDENQEKRDLMVKACFEMAAFHYENNKVIQRLYQKYHFHPKQIQSFDDLEKIPFLGVSAMKYNLLHTLPEERAVLKLTSSGTKGQKTEIWFDQGSLDRVQKMLDVYLEQEKITSTQLNNYLVFSYDPDDAQNLGVAYSEKNQLRFAPVKNVHYLVKKDPLSGQWIFHKELALDILKQYEKEEYPIRIFGMPAFIYEFINFLKEKNEKNFNFPTQSWMISGGGWKAAEDKKISREEFRQLCAQTFGIGLSNIRDAYGMAEHSAPYFHCRNHRFHIPVFNHLIIRDPATLRALPDGTSGLLELITPFNAIMPTIAILSTDWASIDPAPCACGFKSKTFTLLGRAGKSKHKGCAIHADDIIKRH